MRLVQIKLAGFKSFADPTLIELKDAFTGIVGPNGCGKSNIIDAVRWVLGAGRVSELRGSSTMTELIFAGSSTRSSLGRAMVELVLDNSDGTVKGAWGAFTEISVRRIVTRDGTSAYFINHQQVRRRDVQEIFMGTGLGAKTYAIISQGMITDFIKAKPEELRGYIEEAAGVSLYKERRRETETLLRSTRENLDRAGDLQIVKKEEIERLRGEAETAARWKDLAEKKARSESLWYFLQFEEARKAADEARAAIAKAEVDIAEKKAALEEAEAERETFEKNVLEAEARHDRAAKAASEAEKALARLEGELKRVLEKRRTAEREIAEAQATMKTKREALEALEHSADDVMATLETLEEAVAALEEEAAAREEVLDAAREAAEAALEQSARAGQKLNTLRKTAAEHDARAAAGRARLEELTRRAESFSEAREALAAPDESALAAAREASEEAEAAREEALARLEESEETLSSAMATLDEANEAYFSGLSRLKGAAAKLETLEDVQRRASQSGKAASWFEETGLEGMPELAQAISIDPEWVTAFEAVLENRVRAILLRDLRTAQSFEKARPPVRTVFAAPAAGIGSGANDKTSQAAGDLKLDRKAMSFSDAASFIELAGGRVPALLQHVRFADVPGREAARDALLGWLGRVGTAANLSEALRLRAALREGDLLVTPVGDVVTRASIVFWAADDPSLSILSREQEIRRLADEVATLESLSDENDAARRTAQSKLEAAKAAALEAKRTAARLTGVASEKHEKLAELTRAFEAYKRREADLKLSEEALAEEIKEKRAALEEAEALAEETLDQLEVLEAKVETCQREERRTRERFTQLEREALKTSHACDVKKVELQERRSQSRQLVARRSEFLSDIAREEKRLERAQKDLEEAADAGLEGSVDERLAEIDQLERQVRDAAEALAVAKEKSAANERIARTLREQILPLMESLGDLRASAQQKETLRDQFSERMDELGADWTAMAVLAETRGVKASTVRNEVSRLMSEMAGLGPVNHAALEHLEAAQKAFEATAAQIADLEQAIATLEAAIRKIDQETRSRMRETFDKVNANFDDCFKGLFGGGRASLVMTGDEILSAGIEVIAQPPGKRNATVSLLSGGEQTLTATALVFAMFRLNPAPFCLLDEVDAPLDEANQGRLASLCRKMSEATQFLIITHNRVTMEFASALIGVTMKEPGVSRVVSVDIEEAVKYAQTTKES